MEKIEAKAEAAAAGEAAEDHLPAPLRLQVPT